ncbi:hypothetical protein PYCCODRAFT_1421603 [Trametes coccinea BRFM310]|uniref:Uncharacterized protein n=1 Tax=Trametes coccinea (strain BRFM310) TaxID=1353009 RepID=A0A1Y2J2M1_TRAC3|nr:hypothetical protein PYCCODRAFT_1421603 [Trametes coccinea BRFM310]
MNASNTATAVTSPDIECAALLWKLHQKRQLALLPDQLAWLEAFLGKGRLQFEVENDSELKAEQETKVVAAAALLIAGQCQLPLYGLDLETVTGLMRVVVDWLQGRNTASELQALLQQHQQSQPASSTSGSHSGVAVSGLLVSGADIVMDQVAAASSLNADPHVGLEGTSGVFGTMTNFPTTSTSAPWK